MSLTAFAKSRGIKSWLFRRAVLQRLSVDDPKGLEPWRQLEQRGRELPVREPEQEQAGEPEQQPWLPRCPEFQRRVADALGFRMEQFVIQSGRVSARPTKPQLETARCW